MGTNRGTAHGTGTGWSCKGKVPGGGGGVFLVAGGAAGGVISGMLFHELAGALPRVARTTVAGLPWPHVASGKVREIFDLGDALLLVATDRLSAFDVILPDGIPGKGIILTQMSNWWFARTGGIVRNHLLPDQDGELRRRGITDPDLARRSMVVRQLQPLPLECVARGYLTGSAWTMYQKNGYVNGHPLPAGLRPAEPLPAPLFTPTTKAPRGEHDLPIDDPAGERLVGPERYAQVRALSLELYRFGEARARAAGMILADTKFEFGTDATGGLFLIDEVLTPDSSRYWDAAGYAPGGSPPSFDKQFVRDHLLAAHWDQRPPAPRLPPEVVARTQEKYLQALERLLAA